MAPVNGELGGNGYQKKATEEERRDNIKLTTAEVRREENALKGYNGEARARTRTHQGERGGANAENGDRDDKTQMKP